MRYIWLAALVFYNAVFLVTPIQVSAAAPVANSNEASTAVQESLSKAFTSKKVTIRDFINTMKKNNIPADYVKDLESRAKDGMKDTLEYDILGKSKFVLRSQGNEVMIEVLNLEEGSFKINNRKVTLDFSQSPERIWKSVSEVLERKTSAHPFMTLLMPEAQAFWGWVAAIGIGLTGFALYQYGSGNCEIWRRAARDCSNFGAMTEAGKCNLGNQISTMNKWYKISWNCGSVNGIPVKDAAKSCSMPAMSACGTPLGDDAPVLKGHK